MSILNTDTIASDSAFVNAVLAGDREQFAALVRRYIGSVHGLCYAATGSHADADDLSQDIFLKAYLSLDQLREPEKFPQWLMAIARNRLRGHFRSKQMLARSVEANADMPNMPDIE